MKELLNLSAYRDLIPAAAFVALGAVGMYLLLPHRLGLLKPKAARLVGGGLMALAIAALAAAWTPPGAFVTNAFFYAFGIASIASGVLMITSRDPVHSALWFAAVVLSSSGLFLLAGAQFLAAGTVIVYAGAIIVTFLFVIMLAQQEGQAVYDRAARAPARATLTCFMLLFGLFYALLVAKGSVPVGGVKNPFTASLIKTRDANTYGPGRATEVARVIARAVPRTAELGPSQATSARGASATGIPPQHVAGLGATLFTDNLFAAEAAGVLLFVSLVGAIAIATPKTPIRPGGSDRAQTENLLRSR